jgi:hypothetical protein
MKASSSTLEQEYARILGDLKTDPKEEVEKETPQEEVEEVVEQEEAENLEEEGVDNDTAEASQDEQTKEEEGEQELPSEIEEELKNIDPSIRDAIVNASAEIKKAQIEAFKKMRSGIDKKHTELGAKKKIAESVEDIFNKYGLNVNRDFAKIEQFIQFEKQLNKDPRSVVKSIKEMFKIEDEQVGSQKEPLIDEDSMTETEKLLYQQIQEANKKTERLLEENRKVKESTQRQEDEKALKEVVAFRNATNEDGTPKNPYFDDLIDDMEDLFLKYPNESVEKIYSRAVRNNDTYFQKMLDDVKIKERVSISKQKEEAVKKAKSVNSQSVKSSSGRGNEQKSLGDIFDDILSKSGVKL